MEVIIWKLLVRKLFSEYHESFVKHLHGLHLKVIVLPELGIDLMGVLR
jgi:hypothetical protein